MQLLDVLSLRLERMRGRLLLFAPVMLGIGVGAYFGLASEPGALAWSGIAALALGLAVLGYRAGRGRYPGLGIAAYLAALVLCGTLSAGYRSYQVAGPVIDYNYYGPVEGRIIAIDRSQSAAVRLTLDQVRLTRTAPGRLPKQVRVSLHGPDIGLLPEPGMRVMMTAFLSGPNGPVEPGGFDFQRMAWFREIGAVGYSRTPVLAASDPVGQALWLSRLRLKMSRGIRAVIPGQAGEFAAAIATGDRSDMSEEIKDSLRKSNLAHLLAISGLHMGLLTGFVFTALRLALAMVPILGARVDVRKPAALSALLAGLFYLALSGWAVSTERAYIMVAVMFGAVLFGRRALTLRAVALAAVILLLIEPETMVEPGFQMSFAATTALVAVFGALRENPFPTRLPSWAKAVLAVVLSSFVAGAATAPFSAAHFNQVSQLGLIANVLSVPLMGALIMPLAVLAALLAPLGLAVPVLMLMRWPIEWILMVARKVSSLEGAVGYVAAPPGAVLPMLALGALALILLKGRGRFVGAAPVALSFLLWAGAERPMVLVSQSGGLIGLMTEDGRALSKGRGEGFAANSWLENDGDPALQSEAAARTGFTGKSGARSVEVAGVRIAHLTGRGAAERVAEACARADVVVVSAAWEGRAPSGGCLLLDKGALSETGPVALTLGEPGNSKIRVLTTNEKRGQRPWTR